jgi:hypothetical protein
VAVTPSLARLLLSGSCAAASASAPPTHVFLQPRQLLRQLLPPLGTILCHSCTEDICAPSGTYRVILFHR